jgi:hypothetical protein
LYACPEFWSTIKHFDILKSASIIYNCKSSILIDWSLVNVESERKKNEIYWYLKCRWLQWHYDSAWIFWILFAAFDVFLNFLDLRSFHIHITSSLACSVIQMLNFLQFQIILSCKIFVSFRDLCFWSIIILAVKMPWICFLIHVCFRCCITIFCILATNSCDSIRGRLLFNLPQDWQQKEVH